MYAPVYEGRLILQLHRLPFVAEKCGKSIHGRFLGPHNFIPLGKREI
jgi:hypothetical protein